MLQVVLMSATIDSDLFASYFARPIGGKKEKAPVYKVVGRTFDVAEYYLDDLQQLGPVCICVTSVMCNSGVSWPILSQEWINATALTYAGV
jgi:HrpA-like RNA helicase